VKSKKQSVDDREDVPQVNTFDERADPTKKVEPEALDEGDGV